MINNLNEYLNKVESIIKKWRLDKRTTTHPWYRGHSSEKYKLIPSLFRPGIEDRFEREIQRDFKLNSYPFLETKPATYVELLFIMQHFGLPTRLLDWSESYLTALYFAVEEYENDDQNPSVWVLDPWSLNQSTINLYSIPTHESDYLRDYEIKEQKGKITRFVDANPPIAIRALRNNDRIYAQKGNFTLHGKFVNPLNDIRNINLEEIVINKKNKKEIFRQLYKAGITPSKIYPDLTGLSKEIKIKYQDSYMK